MACVVALASAPAARAGGFGLSVALPPAHSGSRVKAAALLVRAECCYAAPFTVSARAEGLVNGRRRSIPLRVTQVSTDPQGGSVYAIRRQWPRVGVWVLTFTGTARGAQQYDTCKDLLELGPNGSIASGRSPGANGERSLTLRPLSGERGEIEAALRGLAARASRNAALAGSGRSPRVTWTGSG
jgi:hypothetical protein